MQNIAARVDPNKIYTLDEVYAMLRAEGIVREGLIGKVHTMLFASTLNRDGRDIGKDIYLDFEHYYTTEQPCYRISVAHKDI